MTATDLSVCVIIPSLNSPIIDAVVAGIEAQAGAARIGEIIVVGKDEAGLLPHNGRTRLIDTGEPVDASTARNLGMAATAADMLIFLDSDCVPQPGWLDGHLAAHAAGHCVVGGGVLPDGINYWHLTYNLAMFHEVFSTAPAGARPFLPTLNLSVTREVIQAVGGLDVTLPYSHDLDWTTRMRRAGFQPYFEPRAAVQHRHGRTTLPHVWHDCAINGHYARQVRVTHGAALGTPAILRYPWLTLLLSPLIALWVTLRIILKRPSTLLSRWSTWPAIYLTKIAWCWGAASPVARS